MRRRYALRVAANDGCFIPIDGRRRHRWYHAALWRSWRANRRTDGTEPVVVWDEVHDELAGSLTPVPTIGA